MKSSAGLIRTITDPIGYITGLPTFADPGYNMPGMSAIRKHALLSFVQEPNDSNKFNGSHQFCYTVNLISPVGSLQLLHVDYFYGVSLEGLDRGNVMVTISGHIFRGTLPRSTAMAEAVHAHLESKKAQFSLSVIDGLSIIKKTIGDCYAKAINSEEPSVVGGSVETVFLSKIRKHAELYSILLPEELTDVKIVTELLPELMNDYLSAPSINILGFCNYALTLLGEYTNTREELKEILQAQWLPKRKGKLITQIEKIMAETVKGFTRVLIEQKNELTGYMQTLLTFIHSHIPQLCNVENTEELLNSIPFFEPSNKVKYTLEGYLQLMLPGLWYPSRGIPQKGLLLWALLDFIINDGIKFVCNINTVLTKNVSGDEKDYPRDEVEQNAIHHIWGKFSGDFGQIMWCMCYGHLFASEDNNTSAMALLLHRLPKECIKKDTPVEWGNIHGLGDGGSVDIVLHTG